MPGGAGQVTQRRYGSLNIHTYQSKVAAGRHIPAEALISAGGRQVRMTHKKAGVMGAAAVAGGGLYVGHKWHQHNVRKNAERHYNTKVGL